MKASPSPSRVDGPITWDTVCQCAGMLPGAEEGTSYGTPAFKVRGKLFVRLHQSGDTLVVRADSDERALLMRTRPDVFFMTDHYIGSPMMLVRMAMVSLDDLSHVIEEAWRLSAPPKLVAAYDSESPN